MDLSSTSRRSFMTRSAALAGLSLAPFGARQANAAEGDTRVFILSDLHSAYERCAIVLAEIARQMAASPGIPTLIAINGDVFERGNVVALRSMGAVDWAFLEALRALAPVVVNLGNHETALLDDMAETVATMQRLGLTVVSNMGDKRTGRGFTNHVATIAVGVRSFTVVGIATDEIMTYRQPARPSLDLPSPAAWAQANLQSEIGGADIPIVLSHAGVAADRQFLHRLPQGTLIVGGHEHLSFLHLAQDGSRYVHTGSWNRAFAVATISSRAGRRSIEVSRPPIAPDAPSDQMLGEAVRSAMDKHLTDQDRAIAGRLARPLTLSESARVLTQAMARATNSQFGLMSHTTLGAGLPAGPITAHDLAAFIRFDGPLFLAEIEGSVLAGIAGVANQDIDLPLEARRGDFIYMNQEPIGAGLLYRVVTNGWTQLPANQERYLGLSGIRFAEVPERRLRALLAAQLPQ